MKRILLFLILSAVSLSLQAQQAAIATAHPLATAAGEKILREGGNAFDAAVAVAATLAVVEPYSSGLGGGGFFLLHRARDKFEVMIDAREIAPLAAHRDMYLDEFGEVIESASVNGPLSAGIPGLPAVLEHVSKKYGRLALSQNLQPAIANARDGFVVDDLYLRLARFRLPALRASNDAASIFLVQGEVPAADAMIKQPELANTLQCLAQQGAKCFYRGELAQKLVDGVRTHGGIWTLEDLKNYKVVERTPLRGEYRGMKITSVPPPSSGGVALIQMLNMLEQYDLQDMDEAQRMHILIEVMRRAYRDRAEYLGDADFVSVPVDLLTHKNYAAGVRAGIHPDKATPSALLPGVQQIQAGPHTTHFSIVDKEGNRVAATLSINYPFGSGFVAPGTGVLLNDEMDDFSIKPGVPNVYGLVGNQANAIAPGKRMLSSMTPTFLETNDRVAVIGTPGGSRIITMVLLGALAFHDQLDAQTIVNLPRVHHQYLPDQIFVEPDALSASVVDELRRRGHEVQQVDNSWGNMQLVIQHKKTGVAEAAADKRGVGAARVLDRQR